MNFDLKLFEKYRENNCLEVKKAKEGLPNSLWDTYSSMANKHQPISRIFLFTNSRKEKL